MDRNQIKSELPITNETYKAGFVCIVGEPNIGKSTFLNSILEQKLSIVSRKPQTTRKQIIGIYTDEEAQCVFMDSPGVLKPRYKLHESMLTHVDKSVADSDVIFFMINAQTYISSGKKISDDMAYFRLKAATQPIVLGINKIDLITNDELITLIDAISKEISFVDIVPFSALTGLNVKEALKVFKKFLPISPPMYTEDEISIAPERFFVAEIVREKIFEQYNDEIPYSTEVIVDAFKDQPNKKTLIQFSIIVEKESQKIIMIGSGGNKLKWVGIKARKDIETFLGRPVFIEMYVKIRKDWRKKPAYLKEYGY